MGHVSVYESPICFVNKYTMSHILLTMDKVGIASCGVNRGGAQLRKYAFFRKTSQSGNRWPYMVMCCKPASQTVGWKENCSDVAAFRPLVIPFERRQNPPRGPPVRLTLCWSVTPYGCQSSLLPKTFHKVGEFDIDYFLA